MVPSDDSASAAGRLKNCHEASADRASNSKAVSNAIDPREGRRRGIPKARASSSNNTPQPMNASAWFRKVADGGTLYASSTGAAIATLAAAASHASPRACGIG